MKTRQAVFSSVLMMNDTQYFNLIEATINSFNLIPFLFVVLSCVCFPVLSPCPVAAASARRCHSIYKGFAQCLMALGDSLTDSARKDEDVHEIHSICRSVQSHTNTV